MWEIWANLLLPKALKTCPKSNKSPNLVTLPVSLATDVKDSLTTATGPMAHTETEIKQCRPRTKEMTMP